MLLRLLLLLSLCDCRGAEGREAREEDAWDLGTRPEQGARGKVTRGSHRKGPQLSFFSLRGAGVLCGEQRAGCTARVFVCVTTCQPACQVGVTGPKRSRLGKGKAMGLGHRCRGGVSFECDENVVNVGIRLEAGLEDLREPDCPRCHMTVVPS